MRKFAARDVSRSPRAGLRSWSRTSAGSRPRRLETTTRERPYPRRHHVVPTVGHRLHAAAPSQALDAVQRWRHDHGRRLRRGPVHDAGGQAPRRAGRDAVPGLPQARDDPSQLRLRRRARPVLRPDQVQPATSSRWRTSTARSGSTSSRCASRAAGTTSSSRTSSATACRARRRVANARSRTTTSGGAVKPEKGAGIAARTARSSSATRRAGTGPTTSRARSSSGARSSAAFLFVAGMITIYVIYKTINIPSANAAFEAQTSTVYYSDGTHVLGTFAVQNRHSIPYSQIPVSMRNAVVSAENRSFWTDPGLDPKGIVRAAWSNLSLGQHPGCVDDHPAVREDPLPLAGAHLDAEDQGGVHLGQDRPGAQQAADPRGLPEHDLLRAWCVRRRRGRRRRTSRSRPGT